VLSELTDLSDKALADFVECWITIPILRRIEVISELVDISEDNTEVDFTSVFKVCLKDEDPEVRRTSIIGLWEFEDRSLIGILVGLIKNDNSIWVRASAATGLGKFAHLSHSGKILAKDIIVVEEALLSTLVDEHEHLEVRRRALESLAPFNPLVLDKYIEWAFQSEVNNLRCSALYAMGKTGNNNWLPQIIAELGNPVAQIRYEAANACGELDDESVEPYLIDLLSDDDLEVQVASIYSLAKIAGPLCEKALNRCKNNSNPVIKDAVMNALEEIRPLDE
jgi:HEAT repeat protein